MTKGRKFHQLTLIIMQSTPGQTTVLGPFRDHDNNSPAMPEQSRALIIPPNTFVFLQYLFLDILSISLLHV